MSHFLNTGNGPWRTNRIGSQEINFSGVLIHEQAIQVKWIVMTTTPRLSSIMALLEEVKMCFFHFPFLTVPPKGVNKYICLVIDALLSSHAYRHLPRMCDITPAYLWWLCWHTEELLLLGPSQPTLSVNQTRSVSGGPANHTIIIISITEMIITYQSLPHMRTAQAWTWQSGAGEAAGSQAVAL